MPVGKIPTYRQSPVFNTPSLSSLADLAHSRRLVGIVSCSRRTGGGASPAWTPGSPSSLPLSGHCPKILHSSWGGPGHSGRHGHPLQAFLCRSPESLLQNGLLLHKLPVTDYFLWQAEWTRYTKFKCLEKKWRLKDLSVHSQLWQRCLR